MAHSCAMWPRPRAPSSSTRYRVRSSARSTVSGCPSSLLNEPGGATVGPSRSATWASRSLVVVLPDEPVIAAIVSWGRRSTTARASGASAACTSGTTSAGTPAGRLVSAATAPADTAAAAKSCPSARSPGSAANSAPGPASRESMTTGPVTRACGSGAWSSVAPVMPAIRISVIGITRTTWPLPWRPPPRPPPRGHRTGSPSRRCPGRARVPCRPPARHLPCPRRPPPG